ncbi:MAG TPA: hypothetical protein VJK07_01410 [Candidatus Nanoarchaeia archaeon]|nr:hypothetical protein [Candidatus Nanoarchaeia archaeon]
MDRETAVNKLIEYVSSQARHNRTYSTDGRTYFRSTWMNDGLKKCLIKSGIIKRAGRLSQLKGDVPEHMRDRNDSRAVLYKVRKSLVTYDLGNEIVD